MARQLRERGLSLAVVGLLVVAVAVATPEPVSGASGDGHVVRVAQKSRVKKKARGKRGAMKEEAPAAGAEAADTPTPAAAPADGTLKFSRDIAPILVSNCAGCHNPRQKRGKLDMSSFEKLMEGTPKEKVIEPGKPEESHLILRIKGEETPRMPQGANRKLSDAAIAKLEQWVKAGAVLDAGINPKDPLEKYAASTEDLRKAELARMSPDQRDKAVETVARERWKKGSPKSSPAVTPSAHFLLIGTLPQDRAGAAVKAVESQVLTVKGLLGPAAVDWGEKATLFVFNDAASFGEFVRAVENREVEAGETGTARFTGPQPYVAVVDPLGGRDDPGGSAGAARRPGRSRKAGGEDESAAGTTSRTLPGLLTEQFAIGAAGRAGKPPRWLTLGLGALVASKVEGRGPYHQKIRRDASQLFELGWASRAQDALGDGTKTEEMRAVGFAVLEWLASVDRSLVPRFVAGMMAGGEKLDDVVGRVLQGSRDEFLAGSGSFVSSRYGR